MIDDQAKTLSAIKQADEWSQELRDVRNAVDKFADKFALGKGLSATWISRTLNSTYYALGQIEYRDLRQAAEDNSQ
jgi:hypothetical protein